MQPRYKRDANLFPNRERITPPTMVILTPRALQALLDQYHAHQGLTRRINLPNGISALTDLLKAHDDTNENFTMLEVAQIANILVNRDKDHVNDFVDFAWDPDKLSNQVFDYVKQALIDWAKAEHKNVKGNLGLTPLNLLDRKGNPLHTPEGERAQLSCGEMIGKAVRRGVKNTTNRFIFDMLKAAERTGDTIFLKVLNDLLTHKFNGTKAPVAVDFLSRMQHATATHADSLRLLQHFDHVYFGQRLDFEHVGSQTLAMLTHWNDQQSVKREASERTMLRSSIITRARINHAATRLRSAVEDRDDISADRTARNKAARTHAEYKSTSDLFKARTAHTLGRTPKLERYHLSAKPSDIEAATKLLSAEYERLASVPTTLGSFLEPSDERSEQLSLLGEVCYAMFQVMEKRCGYIQQSNDRAQVHEAQTLDTYKRVAFKNLVRAARAMNVRALATLVQKFSHGCEVLGISQNPLVAQYFGRITNAAVVNGFSLKEAWNTEANPHKATIPFVLPGRVHPETAGELATMLQGAGLLPQTSPRSEQADLSPQAGRNLAYGEGDGDGDDASYNTTNPFAETTGGAPAPTGM